MYFPDEIILPKAIFITWRHVLILTRVATVSVPIVAEICARRGAGFSRFLQLVPGEGESQTTGKLCVLHFLYEGQLNFTFRSAMATHAQQVNTLLTKLLPET